MSEDFTNPKAVAALAEATLGPERYPRKVCDARQLEGSGYIEPDAMSHPPYTVLLSRPGAQDKARNTCRRIMEIGCCFQPWTSVLMGHGPLYVFFTDMGDAAIYSLLWQDA